MASKTDIINMALRSLGADSITIGDETSENARKILGVYEITLKALLRIHPWNFAKKEVALSRLAETPELDDFEYIYSLPSDYINLVKTSVSPTYAHKIKGRKLYSNSDAVSIEYIAYITATEEYDDTFVETLAAKLAAEVAYNVTGDKVVMEFKWKEFKEKFNYARSMNGQETTPDEAQQDAYLNSRI